MNADPRLERRILVWQILTTLALFAGLASLVITLARSSPPSPIRAQAFVVVDDKGAEVAWLHQTAAGPELSLRADQADAVVMVGSMGNDAGVGIVSKERQVTLAVSADGYPGLSLRDSKAKAFI